MWKVLTIRIGRVSVYGGEVDFQDDIFQEISVGEIMPGKLTPLLDGQDLNKEK